MKLNKKLICFLTIMLITLLSCCIVSAHDNTDTNTTTTQNHEVTITKVEQTTTNKNIETIKSTQNTIQSDNTQIEETEDKNEVEDKQNKTKVINKAKITSIKNATDDTKLTSWTQLVNEKHGTYYLNSSITATSSINLDGDLTIDGNGYTIDASGLTNLFSAGTGNTMHAVTLKNVVITGLSGYVIVNGKNHQLTSSIFTGNGGVWQSSENHAAITVINCLVSNCNKVVFDCGSATKDTVTIYNSIFKDNSAYLIECNNHMYVYGYNFIVEKGSLDDIMTENIALDHFWGKDGGTELHGSKETYFRFHNKYTFDVSTQYSNTHLEITPTYDQVYINETNHVTVRLIADKWTYGVPNVEVNINITYADGTTKGITGVTNHIGEVYVVNHDGSQSFDLVSNKTGIVKISASFTNPKYKDDNGKYIYGTCGPTTGTYKVIALPATINAQNKDADIYKTVAVPFNVTSDDKGSILKDGIVTIKSGGQTIDTIDLATQSHQFNVYSTQTGSKTYTLSYQGDNYYANDKTVTVTFKDNRYVINSFSATDRVGYVDEPIESPFNIRYNNANVNVGNVSIYIKNGNSYTLIKTVDLSTNAERNVEHTYSSAGTYTLFYNYTDLSGTYKPTSTTSTVTVNKVTPIISIESITPETIYVGDTVTVTARIYNISDVNAKNIKFTFNDTTSIIETTNNQGIATANYTNTDKSKPVKVTICYTSDDTSKYNSAESKESTFTINKIPTVVTPTVLSNKVGNFVVNVQVDSTKSGFTVNEGKVVLYDGDEVIGEGNVNNGIATITNNTITVRENRVFTAVYTGEDIFKDNSGSTSATDIVKNIGTLSITDINTIKVNETVTITATLKDGDTLLSGKQVQFTFSDGYTTSTQTTTDGVVSVKYNSTTGDKTVTVTASLVENDYYTANDATDTFNVDKLHTKTNIISVSDMQVGLEGTILVSLNTTDDKPVNGENVDLYINGYNVATNVTVNGIASFKYTPVDNTTLSISAEYEATGSNVYYPSQTVSSTVKSVSRIPTLVTISGVPTTAEVAKDFTFTVKLTNATHQPISGKQIIVTVNGEVITGLSNTNTIGEILVPYTPVNNSDIIIKAEFVADSVYDGNVTTDDSLTGDKISLIPTLVGLKVADTVTALEPLSITVNLTNTTGDIVSGSVTVYVKDENGNIYHTENVEIDGDAKTFTFTPQNNTKLYVSGVYSGDDKVYAGNTSKSYMVDVDLVPTITSISDVEGVVGVPVTITASVSNKTDTTSMVKRGNVTFKLDDGTVLGVKALNTDGTASISVLFNNTNTTGKVIAYYHDDNVYADSNTLETSKSMTIGKGEAIIEVTSEISGRSGETKNITAKVFDKNTGKQITDGKVIIDGHEVSINQTTGLAVYEYTITASKNIISSFESDDYIRVTNKTTVTKTLIPTTTTVNPVNGVVNRSVTITALIKNGTSDVDGGSVTFKLLNDASEITLGTSSVTGGSASISYTFNRSYPNGKIVAYYTNGSEVYNDSQSSSDSNNINLEKINVTISISSTDNRTTTKIAPLDILNYTITLKDQYNQPISGKQVQVYFVDIQDSTNPELKPFNDGEYSGSFTTDENGIIDLDDDGQSIVSFIPTIDHKHAIIVSFSADNTYNANETSVSFDVEKIKPDVRLYNQTNYKDNRQVKGNGTLFYTATYGPQAGENIQIADARVDITITYINGSQETRHVTTDAYGNFTFEFTKAHPTDNFTLQVTHIQSTRYQYYTFEKIYLNGSETFSSIDADNKTIKINETSHIMYHVYVKDDNRQLNGIVTFFNGSLTGNKIGEANVTNGWAYYNFTSPVNGTFDIYAKFYNETERFSSASEHVHLIVNRLDDKITYEVLNHTVYNTTLEVSVTNPLNDSSIVENGTVTIYNTTPDGQRSQVLGTGNLVNGKVNITLADTSIAKDYNLIIHYSGNDYFLANQTRAMVSVNKLPVILSPTVTNSMAGNVSISVDVTSDYDSSVDNGTVNVYLEDGTTLIGIGQVHDGKTLIQVKEGYLDVAKDYPLIYKYTNSSTFNDTKLDKTVTVTKRDANITVKVEDSTIGNVIIKANVTDSITDKQLTSGTVNVTIDEVNYTGTIKDGIATIIIANTSITSGTYTVNYTGNATYNPRDTSVVLTITKFDTTTKISVPESVYVAREFEFTVSLNNATTNNNPISGENITVTINNKPVNVTYDQTRMLFVGRYTPSNNTPIVIVAKYNGSTVYNPSNDINDTLKDDKINLIPTLVGIKVADNVTVNEALSIMVNLTNTTGDIVSGSVTVYVKDENGNIYHTEDVQIDDEAKTFTFTPQNNTKLYVTGIYSGDGKVYAGNTSKTSEVSVNLRKTNLTINVPDSVNVSEAFNITVTLRDNATGNKIVGQTEFTVKVNNKTVTLTPVDDVYVASYTPKNNTALVIDAAFNGNNVYAQSNATCDSLDGNHINLITTNMTILVPDSVKVGTLFTFNVTLTNKTGETIPGKVVNATVNDGNNITLTYDPDNQVYHGNYTPTNNDSIIIRAEFMGDIVYAHVNATNNSLTGDKIILNSTHININAPDSVDVKSEVIVRINLSEDDDSLISPENVTVVVKLNDNTVTTGVSREITGNELILKYTPSVKGKLNITASYPGSNGVYLKAEDKTAIVTVNPLTTSVNVNLGHLVATNTSNITLTVPDDAKEALEGQTVHINLTESNGTKHELSTTIHDGTALIPITPVISGSVTYNVSFEDNNVYGTYTSNDNTGNVDKMPVTLKIISEDDVQVNTTLKVQVELKDANGNIISNETVSYKVHDTSYQNKTDNGIVEAEYPVLTKGNGNGKTGNINIHASYAGSPVYEHYDEITKTVNTHGINTTVKIVKDQVTAQRQNSHKIQLVNTTTQKPIKDKSVTITVKQDGTSILDAISGQTDDEGYITLNFTPRNTNDITITAQFDDDEVYNGNESSITYTLADNDFIFITPTINLTATNTTVFKNNTIKVTLSDDKTRIENQNVTVTVDGDKKTYLTNNDGQIIITNYIFDTHKDMVTVTVVYGGNNTLGYNSPGLVTTTYIVYRANTTITAQPTNKTSGNTTFEITVKDADNNDVPYGNVTIKTGQHTYKGNITNGKTTITISDLPKGTYNFTAEYQVNDVYNHSSTTDDLNNKESLENIEIIGRKANITYTPINNTYHNTSIMVNLYDNTTGENLTGETVIVYNETGQEIGRGQIQENGNATITLDLPIGEDQLINITYPGNNVYDEVFTIGNLDIQKRNSTITTTITNNIANNVTITAIVKDATNQSAITSGYVNVTANGKPVGRIQITSADGQVIIPTNITEKGKYDFIVSYEGNNEYYPSTTNNNDDITGLTQVEVVGRSANITYNVTNNTYKNVTLEVNLYDNETLENLTGETVIVYNQTGDEIGHGKILENGNATITIDLPIGENQTIKITYPGNKTYNKTEVTGTITVNKRQSNITAEVTNTTAANVTIKAVVLDATNGSAVTSGWVNVTANGELVGRIQITSDDGSVTVPTNITIKDKYDFVVNYEGNTEYYPSTTNNNIDTTGLTQVEVVGRNATIDANTTNQTFKNTTVLVQLNDTTTGEALANATINITVNGTTVGNGTTDENGTVLVQIDLPVGDYNLTVTYPGNQTYNSTSKKLPISIIPRNSTTNASVSNNTAGNVTIVANVTDTTTGDNIPNGPVEVLVNDTVVGSGEVEDGKVTVITNITEKGEYNLTVVYKGNENYTSSEDLVSDVEVVGRTSEIIPEVTNTTLGNTTINITLVDPVTNTTIPNATVIVTLPNATEVNGTTDENGTVTIQVDIPVGNNTINVTYPGNETYNGTNTTVPINVTQRNSTTIADVLNNTAGNVTIVANVTDTTTGANVPNGPVEVLVNDTVVGSGEVEDGKVTVITNITEKGEYNLTVVYKGNENYTSSEDLVSDVEIVGRTSEIIPEVTNNTVGNTTINVTLVDPVTNDTIPNATVIVTLPNGTNITTTTDENGTANVTVPIPVGNNTINVTYPGNETYNGTNTTVPINVTQRDSTTIADVLNNTAGNVTIVANVTDTVTGEPVPNGPVEVLVNDTIVGSGEIENGTVIVVTNITEKGEYNLTVVYKGNENYTSSEDNLDDIEVVGRESEIIPTITNTTVGNTTINITLVDPVTNDTIPNATVIVTLPNGTNITTTTDENGTANVTVPIPVGNNTINVTYPGNETYNGTNTTVPINVTQRNSTTVADVLNNTAGNVTIVANVTDTTTGEPVPNGPVEVLVNDTIVGSGEIENGTVTVITNITEIGKYNITVLYKGNENYTSSEDSLDDVEVVGREVEIIPTITNTTVGNTTINVTLVDPVTNDTIPNATVIVTLPNGTNITTTTDDNGTVNVTVPVPVGDNNITVTYPGNETYNATNVTVPIDVTKRDSTTVADILNNTAGNVTIVANVTDTVTGEPVPNGPVDILVNDTIVGSGEIVNGTVTITTNITEKGEYNLTIIYKGNENYTSSEDNHDGVEVVGRESELNPTITNNTVGNTTLNVTLVDPVTNTTIPNATVIVTLPDGTNITTTTDNNGTVVVDVELPAGNNNITITYPGDETYNATQSSIPVNVDKRDSLTNANVTDNIVDEVTVNVTVTDPITGKVIPNGPVVIKVNDTIVGTGEIVDGKATIPLNLSVPGVYDLIVKYEGNENYTSSEKVLNDVKVSPKEAIIEGNQLNDTIGHSIVEATLIDHETGEVIANELLEFIYDDKVIGKGITNNDGEIIVQVDLPAGNYVLDVVFTGNSKYNRTIQKLPIHIKKHSSELSSDVISNIVDDTEIGVELVDPDTGDKLINKTVIISLDNGTEITSTTDENGELVMPVNLPAGENNLTVSFAGDGYYNASTIKLSVNIIKREAILATSVSDVNGQKSVIVSAIDSRTNKSITSGIIELTLPDGSKVKESLDETGVVVFTNISLPVGVSVVNVTLKENPTYNEADADVSINVTPSVRIIKIGEWKLIAYNITPENNTVPAVPAKTVVHTPRIKAQKAPVIKNNNRHSKYNKHDKYNKKSSWKKPGRHTNSIKPKLSKMQYRLLITLYREFLEEGMSFNDFVAVLKLNGIVVDTVSDWNSNGELVLEFEDLEDIPDTIEIHDNSGHLEDYSQNIHKDNAPSDDGVIDSGDVEVKTKAPANTHSDAKHSESGNQDSVSGDEGISA